MATLADQAVELIRKHGSMRSPDIESKLGCKSAASFLQDKVDDGTLVSCRVINGATGRSCNEYRLSVAGGGRTTEFRDLGQSASVQRGLARMAATARGASETAEQPAPPPVSHDVTQHREASHDVTPPNGESAMFGPIEDGIPIPRAKRGSSHELRAHMAELQIGQSFETAYSPRACYDNAKALGIQITRRPVKGTKRIRVWRIK